MDILWSISTTIRNPERIPGFFKSLEKINGMEWNHETQKRFQSILIMDRVYSPTYNNLSDSQIKILEDVDYQMSYDQAREIFDSKKYTDPPMRGRTSFDPLEKMGLANIIDGKIQISEIGQMFLNDEIDFGDVIFKSFIKWQYPNPLMDGMVNYNIKPFINALRVIKRVNEICSIKGLKEKGISRIEFGIFVLSQKRYNEWESISNLILDFREKLEKLSDQSDKNSFINGYITEYLSSYQNPHKNVYEYSDNMIRCLRLTNLVYIRGNGYYIDLEPRRSVEINSLLSNDDGSCKQLSKLEWINYMGSYNSYQLPWNKLESLIEIRKKLLDEIFFLSKLVNEETSLNYEYIKDLNKLIEENELLRILRNKLQNKKKRLDFQRIENIDLTIEELTNIRNSTEKASVELERLATDSLNILNDATMIKPNYPVGDDNKPTFTAPSLKPDIECFYSSFNSICEVTMLTGRNQWYNEGQPVMRHLREFEVLHFSKPAYCLFIAPRLHQDTLNTFWNSVKYEYQGTKQRIIPLTVTQLIEILLKIKSLSINNHRIKSDHIRNLFDSCVDVKNIPSSADWKSNINFIIENWTRLE